MKNTVLPKPVSVIFRRVAGVLPWLLPTVAWAADDIVRNDGRLQGYPSSVTLPEPGGYFGTWVMLLLLGVVVTLVVFKNAKRTHLD